MAVSLVLLVAVFAVVNGRPELTNGAGNEEAVLEAIKTKTHCYHTLEVVYSLEEGEPPYPLCSSRCLMGEELWIDGVVFKRLSELEAYGLMVELTYKNGSLRGCKMVPYDSAENSSSRQEAQKRCQESVYSNDTESQDEVLVLSVTERLPAIPFPLHQLLEGFTPVGNSYYSVSPNALSWHDAVKYCNRFGAPLALIESSVEQNYLKGVLSTDVWIDLNDIDADGIFVNSRNIRLTYSYWSRGEPNNDYNGTEDCGMMYGSHHLQWNDIRCHVKLHALCEHPPVKKPQAQYRCPRGFWQHESSCYIQSSTADTYSRGEEFCSRNGAYPVFINSEGEHNYLAGKLTLHSFIGYTDREVEGTFVSNRFGLPLFKRWYGNQPDRYIGDEDCVVMRVDNQHHWHDYLCDSQFRILCEKAAEIQPEIPDT